MKTKLREPELRAMGLKTWAKDQQKRTYINGWFLEKAEVTPDWYFTVDKLYIDHNLDFLICGCTEEQAAELEEILQAEYKRFCDYRRAQKEKLKQLKES